MLQAIYKALSDISLLQWVIVTVIWIVLAVAVAASFMRWTFRRHWRLYKNLKRPVIVLEPQHASGAPVPDGSLAPVIEIMRKSGLLNVKNQPSDHRHFDPSGKHCVVVLGYRPSMTGLEDILTRIKSHHVPLIVYTYGSNKITGEDKAKLDGYPFTLYANFPLTLLNHIFATVASYPYDPK